MIVTYLQNSHCPSCESAEIFVFYRVANAPANSVLLIEDRRRALNFPTGDIELGFCKSCGFIYNLAFDARLVEYSPRYEETQGYSAAFRTWHLGLARRLIDHYELRDQMVLEIGCGKGEFLSLLCESGAMGGIGYDPGYVPERNDSPAVERLKFYREQYTGQATVDGIGLVCCKMTLEHIQGVGEFVRTVRRGITCGAQTAVFFQVPNVRRILEEGAFWDVYYEHCSYFSGGTLSRLFRRSGFDVLDLGLEYADQYITIEARPSAADPAPPLKQEDDLLLLHALVARFSEQQARRLALWSARLREYAQRRKKVVMWGSGSKAVAFLTSLGNACDGIDFVVDINPNRQAHYLPKTGQQIVGPEFLREYQPDVVIVMNAVYQNEIAAELSILGLKPEVTCL
jgi:hypothetical protein